MDYAEHVDAVARETRDLVVALRAGPVDAPVPTCPDWTVGDLLRHVGEFTVFWAHVLCEGTGRPKTPAPDMPAHDMPPHDSLAVADWYGALAASLVAELSVTDADQSTWSWVEDRRNAAFVARRCAHELAVHRVDVESARGAPRPIERALAADGIEEIFVMIGGMAARGEEMGRGHGESLLVQAVDGPDVWALRLDPTGLAVSRAEARCDLELRGATSDLELLLYQRPPLREVARAGDGAVLDAWYRAFHFG
jgi:uncharacterized protein (TIGR03083 family)